MASKMQVALDDIVDLLQRARTNHTLDPHWVEVVLQWATAANARITELEAQVAALREDAERLDYVLPIISGSDTVAADIRVVRIAACLTEGLDGKAAIDRARKR